MCFKELGRGDGMESEYEHVFFGVDLNAKSPFPPSGSHRRKSLRTLMNAPGPPSSLMSLTRTSVC